MIIAKHSVVAIDYTLTNAAGTVLDTSAGREPLAYIQGLGNIIPGLEKALEGKKVGDTLKVTIPPEQGYGVRREEMLIRVPRSELPPGMEVEVGFQLVGQTPAGRQVFTVSRVEGEQVILDGNHELAGVTLTFDVTIKGIRPAKAEEISHGHTHGFEEGCGSSGCCH